MADNVPNNAEGSIIIGAGVEFKGDVTVPGLASINGVFEGTLKAGDLLVGESGRVSGHISAETAEIRGAVTDNLTVRSKLTLRATGSIRGALTYSKITVEEGGELEGKVDKIEPQAASPAPRQDNIISMSGPGDYPMSGTNDWKPASD